MLAPFVRIKIYVPVELDHEDGRFPGVHPEDAYLAWLIELIRESEVVGVIGQYHGVYELGPGLEGYVSGESSDPGHGTRGEASEPRSIALITYAAGEQTEAIKAFIDRAAKDHPWEQPVIEISQVRLWMGSKKK